ncbi:MAG: PQQ-dependent sugar dehydrogenase [Acidimicrobiia bacterium]|nr:PQQ-dependent sugar dehydrogenase [Acidimicrobiia bacterium]
MRFSRSTARSYPQRWRPRHGCRGHLWIGVGDGFAAPLADVAAWGNAREAQDPSNLWGSILRIDPEPSDDLPYTIPRDNPFLDDPDARPEVWAYGLRNPWRVSVDDETGDVWVGDVGQFCWEEVDRITQADAGANLGWPAFEGAHEYRGEEIGEPTDHVLPVYEYPSDEGMECSVIGGFVYRGEQLPELEGSYLFGDLCTGSLWALTVEEDDTTVRPLEVSFQALVSIDEGVDGEVLVSSVQEGVLRLEPGSADGGGTETVEVEGGG